MSSLSSLGATAPSYFPVIILYTSIYSEDDNDNNKNIDKIIVIIVV